MTAEPNPTHITLDVDEAMITELLEDLYIRPRQSVLKWSRITNQTAQVRLAYPGQHLASVITGVPGYGTAARGHDLRDESEVKSCSRADQLGQCAVCEQSVLPWEIACVGCGSEDLIRKEDSHWIIAIKSAAELKLYTDATRLVFILFDRPDYDEDDVRVRAWEIWPRLPRHHYFVDFVTDYYRNNFLAKRGDNKSPAPCNLHPLKRDFYLMNPVLTFEAWVLDATSDDARVRIDYWCQPGEDRAQLTPPDMPPSLLKPADGDALLKTVSPAILAEMCEGETANDIEAMSEMTTGEKKLRDALKIVGPEARNAIAAVTIEKTTSSARSVYQRR